MQSGGNGLETSSSLSTPPGMAAAIRDKRWEQTIFGPVDAWPQSLRSALSICLGSGFPIAIYWGPELGLIYNDEWSPILGSKHPWALGRPAHAVWPEIWDTIGPLFDKVMSTGQATRSKDQLLAMHRHGFTEECYFDYTFSPISGEAGKVEGIFNAVVETTFRVIGERRTRLLRDLGERLADASSIEQACHSVRQVLQENRHDLPFALIYLHDEGGAGSISSVVACGLRSDVSIPAAFWPIEPVLVGAPWVRFEDVDGRLAQFIEGAVWPEPCTSALIFNLPGLDTEHPNGIFIAGISPRLALDAEYQSFLERTAAIINAALTRARAAERERERAEELAKLDRAKTTFFSNASHEFRTPLTLMLAPLQDALSRSGTGIAMAREDLALMHRNGLRLLKLVNTLLDFSRIEAGRVAAVFESVDLAQLTADLASNFRSAMERAGLYFSIDCQPLRQQFYVDRDMWEKIVLNLLSNAFKYTLEGGVSVRLVEDTAAGTVELRVEDSGVGIPEDSLPRLFERFYRIENQRGRTLEGTGIGLALVQELTRIHRGTVEASSILGRGTTLIVRLPAGSGHLASYSNVQRTQSSTSVRADAYVEEALRWLPQPKGSPPLATGTGETSDAISERIRLLICDDNADMRSYLGRLFNKHDVRFATDGEEAWRAIQESPPDLVLTDVMMPRLDGFGLLRRLRADERLRHLPLVMLSARAGEEAGAEARAAGADDYVVKPFAARELSLRIDAAFKMARLRRERLAALTQSEQMFRAIADQAPVAIWVADADGLVTYMNRHWYEFTGQRPHQAESRQWLQCVHPDDRRRIESEDIEAAHLRRDFRFEYRLRRADGSYRWMLDSGVPRVDEQGAFSGFIGSVVDITEHREAERILRDSNLVLEQQVAERTKEFNTLWQLTPDILAIADHQGRFVNVNPAATEILGWSKTELLATAFTELLHPDDRLSTALEYGAQQRDGYLTTHFENRYRCKDGAYRSIMWTAVTAGERIYATGRDVTAAKAQADALKHAEEALRQASKMEAVGQLTGGIAHDFNNLLTVVIGNLDSLQRRIQQGGLDRLVRPAENAMAGARRAAALTQRLLAFARRQPLDPKPTDVGRLVLSMSDMLTRTLGERIDIQTVLGAGSWHVEVDPNQLENALLNLAVNARDAMPEGGKLTIETSNAHIDEIYVAKTGEIAAGQYVVLAVSDTGHGMARDVLDRVFEPFFTTKPIGAGSGLGLPQVYGFVKQSGGHVKVYSEPGAGTTVKIYLRRISDDVSLEEQTITADRVVRDGSAAETILVVEDETAVREYSCEVLRELGYRVIEARDGGHGLLMIEKHPEIKVLFTDVGLPGITGRELVDKALTLNPRLKVLFTTGYARNAIVHHGRLDPGVQLLTKPFTYAELAARIRAILDAS